MTGCMAQVIKCLLCKCETLSSNPSPTKKKKKKEEEEIKCCEKVKFCTGGPPCLQEAMTNFVTCSLGSNPNLGQFVLWFPWLGDNNERLSDNLFPPHSLMK
jgi:hypothetical protein